MRTEWRLAALVIVGLSWSGSLLAQQPTPLPEIKQPGAKPAPETSAPTPPPLPPPFDPNQFDPNQFRNPEAYGDRGQYIPWSSDAISSYGQRVGTYGQPQYTTQRPFTSTRTYVLPDGVADLEQWAIPTFPTTGKGRSRFLEELAIGLPQHFQLDVYERWDIDNSGMDNKEIWRHEGVQIEMRWALADWDVIPLNPTLYAEWIQRGHHDESDKYEFKLLLGENFLNDRLFWALNMSFEKELGKGKEDEIQVSQAFATPLIEKKLLGTVEMYYQNNSFQGMRGTPANTFVIGPGFQWNPTNRIFVDFTGLIGTLGGKTPVQESLKGQLFLIVGYQFGKRSGPSSDIFAPSVARSGL